MHYLLQGEIPGPVRLYRGVNPFAVPSLSRLVQLGRPPSSCHNATFAAHFGLTMRCLLQGEMPSNDETVAFFPLLSQAQADLCSWANYLVLVKIHLWLPLTMHCLLQGEMPSNDETVALFHLPT